MSGFFAELANPLSRLTDTLMGLLEEQRKLEEKDYFPPDDDGGTHLSKESAVKALATLAGLVLLCCLLYGFRDRLSHGCRFFAARSVSGVDGGGEALINPLNVEDNNVDDVNPESVRAELDLESGGALDPIGGSEGQGAADLSDVGQSYRFWPLLDPFRRSPSTDEQKKGMPLVYL